MFIGHSSYRDGGRLNTPFETDVSALSAPGTSSASSVEVGSPAGSLGVYTVSLSTSKLDAAEARSRKIAQLRYSIDSGQYRVSAAALASSMIDKADAGSAIELSFLTGL